MSQADHVPDAAHTIPRDERYHTLQVLSKALLDEERLRLVGLLAQQPQTMVALRAHTGLKESRVVRHVQLLEDVGLITRCGEAGEATYCLHVTALHQWKRQLFAPDPATPPPTPAAAVLARFIHGDQLVQLPVQPAKLQLVLQWLAAQFDMGVAYPEREVNQRLQGHLVDHATLRRLLVDYGLLQRQAGIYQRVEADAADEVTME
jgi:hypothetical protein